MAKIDPDEPCPCGSGKLFKECHGPRVRVDEPPTITEREPLSVIPEPDSDTRAVFILTGEGTVVMSGLATGLARCCGTCGAPLIVGLKREQVQGLVVKCNDCGSFNDTTTTRSA